MKNSFSLFIIVLFMIHSLFCQEVVNKVKVLEIINSNSFRVLIDSNKTKVVKIQDTKPILYPLELKEKAINYLNEKIKSKYVFVFINQIKNDSIIGSVLYNCLEIHDEKNIYNDNLPCASGNTLDVELIQQGFVNYIGKNTFLIREKPRSR